MHHSRHLDRSAGRRGGAHHPLGLRARRRDRLAPARLALRGGDAHRRRHARSRRRQGNRSHARRRPTRRPAAGNRARRDERLAAPDRLRRSRDQATGGAGAGVMDNAAQPPSRSGSAPPWTALGMLAVLIFAWGGNCTWISLALRDIGLWTFTAVRYVGAAVVVGVVLAFRGGPSHMMPVPGERARLAGIGLLQGAALTILLTLSLKWIESTHTILLMYTNPLWALLLSVLLLGERFSTPSVVGIALGLLGMAILTNPLAMPWNAVTVPGVVCALAATIAWALGSVLYRREKWESTFWQQVFWEVAG